eukprot:Rhum_TRINITY_DN12042_c1_g1::Rhum_TRINITY_DN12042_c1_g1_i1::g.48961::m.48961
MREKGGVGMRAAALLLLLQCSSSVAASSEREQKLDTLFQSSVLSKLPHAPGAGTGAARSASVQSQVDDVCRTPRASCMAALLYSTQTRVPNPAGLSRDVAACSRAQCGCAGAPASFNTTQEMCLGSDALHPLDYTHSERSTGKTWFPYATCPQVEKCVSPVCDIVAWKKYTTGIDACDAMWFCMRTEVDAELKTCASAVTIDKDNTTCAQADVCTTLQATYDVIPEGKPDCAWEYARVLADSKAKDEIDSTCATTACHCVRRGVPWSCDGKNTCCINNVAWDSSNTTGGITRFNTLTCDDAALCLPAVAYCKLVAEPQKRLPAACRSYPLDSFTRDRGCDDAASATAFAGTDGACAGAHLGTACDLVKAATVARCDAAPLLYQVCPPGSAAGGAGKCVCAAGSTCAAGGACVRTTCAAQCGVHAAQAVPSSSGGCLCVCADGWSGAQCNVVSDDDSWPLWQCIVVSLGACLFLLLVAAAVYFVARRRHGGGCCCCGPRRPELEEELFGKGGVIDASADYEDPFPLPAPGPASSRAPTEAGSRHGLANTPSASDASALGGDDAPPQAENAGGDKAQPSAASATVTAAAAALSAALVAEPPLPLQRRRQVESEPQRTTTTAETVPASVPPLRRAAESEPARSRRSSTISAAPYIPRVDSEAMTEKPRRQRRASFASEVTTATRCSKKGSSVGGRRSSVSKTELALVHAEEEMRVLPRRKRSSGKKRSSSHGRRTRSNSRHSDAGSRAKTPKRSSGVVDLADPREAAELDEALSSLRHELQREKGVVATVAPPQRRGRSQSAVAFRTSDMEEARLDAQQYHPLSPPKQVAPPAAFTPRQAEILARHL